MQNVHYVTRLQLMFKLPVEKLSQPHVSEANANIAILAKNYATRDVKVAMPCRKLMN